MSSLPAQPVATNAPPAGNKAENINTGSEATMDGPAVLLPCDNRESTGGLGVGTTTTERMNEAGAVDAAVADPESGDAETENKRPPSISSTPTSLPVTILLQSGARHQFTLDSEYLSRHSIRAEMQKEVLSNPFEMTVYQLKECIWKDWKEGTSLSPSIVSL